MLCAHHNVENIKNNVVLALYLCRHRNGKYFYLGLAGFECHPSPTPPVPHVFYATAGEDYRYVRSWKAIQRFSGDKPDLGPTYSVLDHNYIRKV